MADMENKANNFLYTLYNRMPIEANHPYFNLSVDDFYGKYHYLFEFYEDNYPGIIPEKMDARILDIGFGFGTFMVYMKKCGFSRVHGVEYCKAQVENIKRMGFVAEEISDLEQYLRNNREKFDFIHASNVIEHLPKYGLIETFDLLCGVLKKGGQILIVVPNIASRRGAYDRYLVLGHETGFSEVSLAQLLRACGFSEVKISGSRIKLRPRIKNIARVFLQKIIDLQNAAVDYIYLGVDRPRHLGQFLLGTARKK